MNISLSQLQCLIHQRLAEQFTAPLWISAEISEIKVNSSGHCYLELVEKGVSDGLAKAQARGVIWRSAYSQIVTKFKGQTTMELQRGVAILARVNVSYHELYGLSLQITDIDPTYTIGEAELRRRQAIERLKKDGSWDMNRAKPMATLVRRVAVVASSKSAGYEDFMRELERSNYRFAVTIFDSVMQGAAAEQSIIDALIAIANRRDEFDVVAVLRGGGSANDLECFNGYRLALHFARFPLPFISGIGHEKDVSVVDLVAHVMVKTPTAVANWLDERMLNLDAQLQTKALELHNLTINRLKGHELKLSNYTNVIATRCEESINNNRRILVDFVKDLPLAARNRLNICKSECEQRAKMVESYSPRKIMEIGFAVVKANNKAATAKGLNINDTINITLIDGEVEACVNKITHT
ncbi:MAG: exodeoxyribonuclease VII large subunit [Rikenellaceae bacterium]